MSRSVGLRAHANHPKFLKKIHMTLSRWEIICRQVALPRRFKPKSNQLSLNTCGDSGSRQVLAHGPSTQTYIAVSRASKGRKAPSSAKGKQPRKSNQKKNRKQTNGSEQRSCHQVCSDYQDLPCTLNWGYMVPNSGYLGPNRR